jgi:hypothetical protein
VPEVQVEHAVEKGLPALVFAPQALFLDHIQAHDAEVADVIGNESGNVVVAHEQQVDRHVLTETEQLVLALGELEAAALEKVQRVFGQAPRLLHRNLDALLGRIHGELP